MKHICQMRSHSMLSTMSTVSTACCNTKLPVMLPPRYAVLRERLLPQLLRDHDHGSVPAEALGARLTAALTTSPFTPLGVMRWQLSGRGHPCQISSNDCQLSRQLSCATLPSSTAACAAGDSSARRLAELGRHDMLARMHWDLTRSTAERGKMAGGGHSSDRDSSATLIQAAWRGRAGRVAAARERARRQEVMRRRDAAVTIQAAVRGWRAERQLAAAEEAAVRSTTHQAFWSGGDDDDEQGIDDEAFLASVDALISFDLSRAGAKLPHAANELFSTMPPEELPDLAMDRGLAQEKSAEAAPTVPVPQDAITAWLDDLDDSRGTTAALPQWPGPDLPKGQLQPAESATSSMYQRAASSAASHDAAQLGADLGSLQEDAAVAEGEAAYSRGAVESCAAADSSPQQERRGSQQQVGRPHLNTYFLHNS